MPSEVFNKWYKKYQDEKYKTEREIKLLEENDKELININSLNYLSNIADIYEELDVISKQRLILLTFGKKFLITEQGLGTFFVNPLFVSKYKKIKGLYYVKETKKGMIFTSFPVST